MGFQPQQGRIRFQATFTPMIKILLWINGLTYLFLALSGSKVFAPLGVPYTDLWISLIGLNPKAVVGDWAVWQLFTYLFVHLGFFHLLFNMLGLWWFGSDLERAWGGKTFLRYYLFTGVGAGLVSVALGIPTIGASGAVFGVLLAYGLLFPNRIIYLYFVIPVKAKYCVMAFGLFEIIYLMGGGSGNVNHFAHLAGIGFGLLWFLFYRKNFSLASAWKSIKQRRMRRRLRVIRERPAKKEEPKGPTIH